MNETDLIALAGFIAAMASGAVLGFDRQLKGKVAGVRTHMLVSLSAAATATVAFRMFEAAIGLYPDARMDPLRAVEGVIAAVGFIGGGLILRTDGGRVRGLTTAANLWASGIVGLAYGTGLFVLGLMITVLGVLVTAGLGALEQRETEEAARESPRDRAEGGRN